MFFVTFIKSIKIFRKPTRPPLPLREAPPLSPSPFPMVFTPPSVPPFPGGRNLRSGDVTAPSRCSEPLRSKVGGPKRSSPYFAGWDRQGIAVYS